MTDDNLSLTDGSVLDLPLTIKSDLEDALRRLGLHPTEKMLELRPLQLAGAWGYASSACMALAKEARQAPQQLAETVVAALPPRPEIARVEALRGFLNFYVDVPAYANRLVREVLVAGDAWGQGRPKTSRSWSSTPSRTRTRRSTSATCGTSSLGAAVSHHARRRVERDRRHLSRRHRHARHQVPVVLPASSQRPGAGDRRGAAG